MTPSVAAWSEPDRPAAARSVQSLYLHIPLCFHKCHYCDFYSIEHDATTEADRQDDLVRAMLGELEAWATSGRLQPRTIFIGGGTPTLLAASRWRRILRRMTELGVLQHVTEFTVEANPETVTDELADVLAEGGVNRVSIGAQSFDPRHLKTLERWHDPANVGASVKRFRASGIANVNLDLIFAVPGQSLADVDADLDLALALEPMHLSYYGLTYEPNTAMTRRLRMGQVQRTDDALERDMYARILDRLDAAGFEHYEISAWARRPAPSDPRGSDADGIRASPPFCRHNLTYWTCGNYLGVGPGAASHIEGMRWKNAPRLNDYIAAAPTPPLVDVERLDAVQRVIERMMMNLRLREGVPLDWLDNAMPERGRIDQVVILGLAERTATHLRLTRAGLFVSDSVIEAMVG